MKLDGEELDEIIQLVLDTDMGFGCQNGQRRKEV